METDGQPNVIRDSVFGKKSLQTISANFVPKLYRVRQQAPYL
jgi:hypothetical protein